MDAVPHRRSVNVTSNACVKLTSARYFYPLSPSETRDGSATDLDDHSSLRF